MQDMKTYAEVDLQLQAFLFSTPEMLAASLPIHFIPEKYLQVRILILTPNSEKVISQNSNNNNNNNRDNCQNE
jgi:hypothetical protein